MPPVKTKNAVDQTNLLPVMDCRVVVAIFALRAPAGYSVLRAVTLRRKMGLAATLGFSNRRNSAIRVRIVHRPWAGVTRARGCKQYALKAR